MPRGQSLPHPAAPRGVGDRCHFLPGQRMTAVPRGLPGAQLPARCLRSRQRKAAAPSRVSAASSSSPAPARHRHDPARPGLRVPCQPPCAQEGQGPALGSTRLPGGNLDEASPCSRGVPESSASPRWASPARPRPHPLLSLPSRSISAELPWARPPRGSRCPPRARGFAGCCSCNTGSSPPPPPADRATLPGRAATQRGRGGNRRARRFWLEETRGRCKGFHLARVWWAEE